MVGLVALGAVPDRGVAVPPHLGATGAHDPLVHRGLHAVILLDVQLGESVVVEHGRLADVTERGSVDNVPVVVGGQGKKRQRKTRTAATNQQRIRQANIAKLTCRGQLTEGTCIRAPIT